jgi:hypothetical protein
MKTNNKRCSTSGKQYPECHCNECYDNVVEYLGKIKGEIYFYNGKYAEQYLRNKLVVIERFHPDGHPSTCEALIRLGGGSGGQCGWIPREEIINNLIARSKFNIKL